jgi:hypothetical protein
MTRFEEGIKGLRMAHPGGDQHFGHRRGQDPVVLDTLEGLGPIGGNSLSSQRMKGVVDKQRLGLVMGSMQCLRCASWWTSPSACAIKILCKHRSVSSLAV